MRLVAKLDSRLSRLIQTWPAKWRSQATWISFSGYQLLPAVMLISAAIAALYDRPRIVAAVGLASFLAVVSLILKQFIHRPRPETIKLTSRWINTYSFPSGHSAGSAICYGLISYLVLEHLASPLAWIVAAGLWLLIFLVGLSRVYLGVHYPSDVLGGWLFGLASLILIIQLTGA